MTRITVRRRWGEGFEVRVRGHRLIADLPVTHGGDDAGPAPAELVVAGVAAGVAQAVHRFLAGAGLGQEEVLVEAEFAWAAAVPEIEMVRLRLELPPGLAGGQRAAAAAAAEAAPEWRALRGGPRLELTVAEPAAVC